MPAMKKTTKPPRATAKPARKPRIAGEGGNYNKPKPSRKPRAKKAVPTAPAKRTKPGKELLGTIFEDRKLKRFVRVEEVKGGTAMLACRRSTTGRFTETKEPFKVTSLRAPRFKLWRRAAG